MCSAEMQLVRKQTKPRDGGWLFEWVQAVNGVGASQISLIGDRWLSFQGGRPQFRSVIWSIN